MYAYRNKLSSFPLPIRTYWDLRFRYSKNRRAKTRNRFSQYFITLIFSRKDKVKVGSILIKTFIPAHIKSPAILYIPYSPPPNDHSMTANEEYRLILRKIRWLQKRNINKYGLLSCKALTMYVLFLIFASQSNQYIYIYKICGYLFIS